MLTTASTSTKFRDGGRVCPRCQRAILYQAPTPTSRRDRFSREWEKVPETCDLYLTGKGQPIQQPGSPLWLGGQEVCPTCAAAIPYQFHYSRYWGTWSRLLLLNHRDESLPMTWVEVNLTPVNMQHPDIARWKESVAPIVIRTHGTSPERGEGSTTLPTDIKEAMRAHLGESATDYLLHEDIWNRISPELLLGELRSTSSVLRTRKQMRGGGVPLIEVMKG